MLKVGLTGGMGSGKSTVTSILKEKGLLVIDADIISREVLNLYPEITKNIRITFGDHFFDADGNLKRRELGNYIFRYPKERKKLEDIIIPAVKTEIFNRIAEYDRSNEKLCIIDAPTLIEHGMHKEMDINILVWVDRVTQISRLKKRDNLSDEQVTGRLNAQISLDDKRKIVDFIIDNSSNITHTVEQVNNIIAILKLYDN